MQQPNKSLTDLRGQTPLFYLILIERSPFPVKTMMGSRLVITYFYGGAVGSVGKVREAAEVGDGCRRR